MTSKSVKQTFQKRKSQFDLSSMIKTLENVSLILKHLKNSFNILDKNVYYSHYVNSDSVT